MVSTVRASQVPQTILRSRYVLIATMSLPWLVHAFRRSQRGANDWLYFEYGARVFVGYDRHYPGGTLSLYAHHPEVQVGPPGLWLVAGLQGLSPHTVAVLGIVFMGVLELVAIRACELSAIALRPDRVDQVRWSVLASGLVIAPLWAGGIGTYRHLDDVIALTAIAVAAAVIARGGRWWWAPLLVGLAMASKPWALVAAPLVLGLPKARHASAALVAMASAAFWWLPFVLGDSHTINALSGYRLYLNPHSALPVMGVHGPFEPPWARPAQLAVGFVLAFACARRGRWTAAPLVGLATRILFDPQVWSYYGMGPLLAALLWDISRERRIGLPIWTASCAVALYLVPWLWPGADGQSRLIWCVLVLASVPAWRRRSRPEAGSSAGPAEAGGCPPRNVAPLTATAVTATAVTLESAAGPSRS